MSNEYFNFANPFIPGTLVRAEEVNEVFAGVEVGFDGAKIQIDRTVRLPVGSNGDLALATPTSRALRVIGFDENGNIQLRSSFAYVGDWMAGEFYKMNSVFRDPVSRNLYTVLLDHTATTISADLTAEKIMLAINVADVFDATAGAQAAAASALANKNASEAATTLTLGYRDETFVFRNQAEQFALTAINAPGTSATSTTSHTVNLTNPKTFAIQPGKEFAIGQFVIIASTVSPQNYLVAQITAVDKVAGSITVNVIATNGSGTFADWTISLTAVSTQGVVITDTSANSFFRIVLTDDAGSNLRRGVNATQNLDYNPSTGVLRTVTFSGALLGNATTATTLATPRQINGTNFNGSANITTANWGTSRNVTIGNTTRSVNGSVNYTWSLGDIGAPATDGTGATGTWNISITGNAATATSATTAGSATSATNSTNVNVTTTAVNASYPFVLAPNQTTGQKALLMDSAGGTYNPSTNTADINISGNAATASSVGSNGVSTNSVQDDAITFPKMQNIPTGSILGRASPGTGDVEALTPSQVASVVPFSSKIQSISATAAANALTVSLNPTVLDFRSPTLSSGAVNTRSVSSVISLTVPAGASLGGLPATLGSNTIVVLAIDSGGVVELAVTNISGGVPLDESGVTSTVAIGSGSTAANVIYSEVARSNVPYRVVGFINISTPAAGVYSQNPTLVQGVGGQALTALSSIGYGQKYRDLTSSRAASTLYYNTTGRPLYVSGWATFVSGAPETSFVVDGVVVQNIRSATGSLSPIPFWGLVPAGSSYNLILAGATLTAWRELR